MVVKVLENLYIAHAFDCKLNIIWLYSHNGKTVKFPLLSDKHYHKNGCLEYILEKVDNNFRIGLSLRRILFMVFHNQ